MRNRLSKYVKQVRRNPHLFCYKLMTTRPGEGINDMKQSDDNNLTPKEQAILKKIREIARSPEEYEKLVDKYLKPAD